MGFSRFYNRRHNRRGFFWGDRFKSVIVEKGETLINCLTYIDLNPVRAKNKMGQANNTILIDNLSFS
jgi:hypothetical protein